MSITKAVAALNADLSNLAKATTAQHVAEHQFNVDTVKERAALAAIDQQKKAITDQFTGPTQPTGARELALLNQLFTLGAKRQTTADSFAGTLAKDRKTISADAATAAKFRAQGKKDLLPAEYTLGLAETNKDRAALGLGPVKTVIRPPAPKPVTYTVKAGDTMSGIAKAHGMTLAALEAANPQVTNPDDISIGQKLNLKAGPVQPPTPQTAADKKRAAAMAFAVKQANDPNVGYSQDGDKRFGQSQGGGHRYYDCSGLVVSAYRSVGVNIPADDTRSMWATRNSWSTELPKNTSVMKPGDLVLINSSSPEEHHVLIYVGNGKCVAASTDNAAFANQVIEGESAQRYFDRYGAGCKVLRPNV